MEAAATSLATHLHIEIAGTQPVTDRFCMCDRPAIRMLCGEVRVQVGRVVFSSQDRGIFLWPNDSCPLLPRVLESLLVSLVTTVVVFVASMVLGECRQMSSSQVGNDSFLLQVTPRTAASALRPQEGPGDRCLPRQSPRACWVHCSTPAQVAARSV